MAPGGVLYRRRPWGPLPMTRQRQGLAAAGVVVLGGDVLGFGAEGPMRDRPPGAAPAVDQGLQRVRWDHRPPAKPHMVQLVRRQQIVDCLAAQAGQGTDRLD